MCGGGSRPSLARSRPSSAPVGSVPASWADPGSGQGVGQGVGGARTGEVQVDLGVLPATAALADLATLEAVLVQHRAVVRRVPHLGVDLLGRTAAAAALGRGVLVERVLVVGLVAHDPLGELAHARRDLVDGRGGDHEHPEDRDQEQQRDHDVRRLEQVEQELGDHEPDGATGLLQRTGVAELGGGRAVGDVHDAEHAEHQRAPADHLAAGRAVAVGVAQVAPGDEDEQQGDEPREQADRPGHDGAGEVADAPGELPPHGGGDHDGQAEQEQAGAVATVLGLEVAGGVADAAHSPADGVGEAQPRGHQDAREGDEDGGDRSGAAAHRAWGRAAGRGAALRRPALGRARARRRLTA